MNRVPEPELMDREEQAEAYFSADLRDLHVPLVDEFVTRFATTSGRLLDVGCGTADMTIRILQACPQLSATGVDGSAAMLSRGREAVRRAGLEARVRLERRTVPDTSFESRFDLVMANSVLHHVIDPVAFWRWLVRCARPGGSVVIADLRRPPALDEARRLVRAVAGDARSEVQLDFFNSLRAAYTVGEIRAQLAAADLSGFSVAPTGELHVLAWGTAH